MLLPFARGSAAFKVKVLKWIKTFKKTINLSQEGRKDAQTKNNDANKVNEKGKASKRLVKNGSTLKLQIDWKTRWKHEMSLKSKTDQNCNNG